MRYAAKTNAISSELQKVWGISSDYSSSYAEDYAELNDESVTWKDKYTICNIDAPENVELFPAQPVPDYLRWFRSGELHYLTQQQRKRLPEGLWNQIPAVFLPSEILSLMHQLFPEPSEQLIDAIAFLSWLPRQDVLDYFSELAVQEAEELKTDTLREKLRNLDLYKKRKLELQQECRNQNLDTSGRKTELAERLALHKNIDVSYYLLSSLLYYSL